MEILKIEDVKQLTVDARKNAVMTDYINSTIKQVNEIIEYFAKEGQSLASIPINNIRGMENDYVASIVYKSLADAGYGLIDGNDVVIVAW